MMRWLHLSDIHFNQIQKLIETQKQLRRNSYNTLKTINLKQRMFNW